MNGEYFIPANIRLKSEIFNGFGVAEFIISLVVLAISATVAIVLYLSMGDLLQSMLIVAISTSITVGLLWRDENNMSFILRIKMTWKYLTTPKKYRYKHLREW